MNDEIDFGTVENHVGFQIHLTWRAIKKRLLAKTRDAGERVSRGSYSVPILIGLNPGISPQELARALHLDASKVALFLRGLETDGLVIRSNSESDGRKVALHLTPQGEAFAKQALAASRDMEAPIAEDLTAEEVAELVRILRKLRGLRDGTGK